MPATTRSHAKQTHLEDFTGDDTPPKASAKRKAKSQKETPVKKRKTKAEPAAESSTVATSGLDEDSKNGNEAPIVINRAPVLDLWASTVTHFLYPALSWETCLSAGSAISALCAISKGRSIGTVDPPDPEKAEERKKERHEKEAALEELDVMGFKLHLNEGLVMMSGKKKSANEAALQKKFGQEEYDRVRQTFEQALETWEEGKVDLGKQAFGFYESFRPNVATGQKSWGRKGKLSLDKIKKIVSKPG